jgi:methionyl-tRNA formyltransferase
LSVIGASVLLKTLRVVSENTITPAKQNEHLSSYAPMLNKSLCEVDWNKPSLEVHNLIRGLAPFLFATTSINNKVIRVISSLPCSYEKGSPGEVVESGDRLVVACANQTAIELLTLQAQGKRPLKTKEFLLGNRIRVGETLG